MIRELSALLSLTLAVACATQDDGTGEVDDAQGAHASAAASAVKERLDTGTASSAAIKGLLNQSYTEAYCDEGSRRGSSVLGSWDFSGTSAEVTIRRRGGTSSSSASYSFRADCGGVTYLSYLSVSSVVVDQINNYDEAVVSPGGGSYQPQ